MRFKMKSFVVAIMVFAVLSLVLMSVAVAVGSITLTPSTQASGGSVVVAGSGFGASKAVGIACGAEVAGSNSNMAFSGTGTGPYSGRLSYWPIKPGSFVLTSDTTSAGGVVTAYNDNGDGTLRSDSAYFVSGTINYVTGEWSRTSTIDLTGLEQIYAATYTRYQYNMTSAGNVTTTASGTFSTSVIVPTVANGNYNVTAIDAQGNRAVIALSVSGVIPESFGVALLILVSSVAVVAGASYFRKRPRIESRTKRDSRRQK